MDTLLKTSLLRLLLPGAFLVLALAWLFSIPINASYPDHIQARAYVEDFAGHEDIHSIQAKQFTGFQGPLFLGNHLRPLWLKLMLAPSRESSLVLQFQSTQTHHVEVWSPEPEGQWRRSVVGTRHAFSQRDPQLLSLATRVTPSPDHAVTLYVKVVSPTTPIHVVALASHDAYELDDLLHLFNGLFIGIGIILSAFSAIAWLASRESLWGLDALLNLIGLYMLCLHLGLAAKLVWPDDENWISLLCLLSNVSYLVLVSLFFDRLLRIFVLPAWYRWPYWLTFLMLPLQLWLIHAERADQAMALNNAMILLQGVWSIVITLRIRHHDWLLLTAFRLFNLGLIGYLVWWGIGMVLQVQTGNLSTLYPMLPTSLFTMVMMLLILVRYTQLRVLAAQQLGLEKRETELRLRQEQLRHEETSSFLGMVLHEVKGPLNYIRMATSNLQVEPALQEPATQQRLQHIQSAVDSVDGVLQRSVDVDVLEQGGTLSVDRVTCDLAGWLGELLAAHPDASRLRLTLPATLMASVDQQLVQLMLRNLLENALRYSPPGSPVHVVVSGEGDGHWSVTLRNLVGLAGHPDPDRLFTKYYRADGALGQSGIGLGLYWVHGVAVRLGGEIRHANTDTEVVFTLWLPT